MGAVYAVDGLKADRHEQPLAAQTATRVMEEITANGYFLQLPPQTPLSSDDMEPAPC